jgi:exonuclease III
MAKKPKNKMNPDSEKKNKIEEKIRVKKIGFTTKNQKQIPIKHPLVSLSVLFIAVTASLQGLNTTGKSSMQNFPDITFSCVNCNSLNMSNVAKSTQQKKLYGITKLKTDIIMLSDIRLCNKNLVSAAFDISKVFLSNPFGAYKFYHNSKGNKRGVGILIKNSLNLQIDQEIRDDADNYLLLQGNLGGRTITIGSVYGPNQYDPNFFINLKRDINDLNSELQVLAGDWNCTVSTENTGSNLDCINMVNPPNLRHSHLLNEMMNDLDLVDPFRALYPEKVDYSYIPRIATNINRSRIDFFIISNEFIEKINDCIILPGLQNNLFDHKAVVLSITKSKAKKSKFGQRIDNSMLSDDLIDYVVKTAIFDTYLVHADRHRNDFIRVTASLNIVGRAKLLIRRCGPNPTQCIPEPDNDTIINRILLKERLENTIGIINQQWIESLVLNTDPSTFMEVLLNNVRNEVTSYQSFIFKSKREHYNNLCNQLSDLKTDVAGNYEAIFNLEKTVNDILESNCKRELEKFKGYEILTSEKITPGFLAMAKAKSTDSRLSSIKKPDGSVFFNDAERTEFIRNFYADLYSRKVPVNNNLLQEINEFLGPILNNPIVQESKLKLDEKLQFESALTIEELDKAIESMNSKTACGPDGIGTAFLKQFWQYFRVPLINYCTFCFRTGQLSDSFRTAAVRLIPKKGDIGDIKNWRPISLLNCVYKIISKAINNRLTKINEIVCSRGQKGFTRNRYIQECLINIIENIAYCNKNNISSFLLSIDQAKAFDTIRHDYLSAVYRFFGMGDYMCNLLNVITTGRNASIILDDGSLSNSFDLDCSAPQGNGPSPNIFNLGQQILIFRIEFDPNIVSIFEPQNVPRPIGYLGDRDLLPLVADPEPDPVPGPAPQPEELQRNLIRDAPLPVNFANLDPVRIPVPAGIPAPVLAPNHLHHQNNINLNAPVPAPLRRHIAAGTAPDPGAVQAFAGMRGPDPVPDPAPQPEEVRRNPVRGIVLPGVFANLDPVRFPDPEPDPDPAPQPNEIQRNPLREAAMPVVRANLGPLHAPAPAVIQLLVPNPEQLPVPAPEPIQNGPRIFGEMESHRETDKVEGFADDGNVMGQTRRGTLPAIKKILQSFFEISGLKCNFNKCFIMIIGPEPPAADFNIEESGFTRVDSIKVLGMNIDKDLLLLDRNFDETVIKMRKIVNFWNRFRLTLPGRIAVSKTFLLAQIGYLGCFLQPTDEQIKLMDSVVNGFIKGSLNVGKQAITCNSKFGGLNMINVSNYITALQCSWFKRLSTGIYDNWRYDLYLIFNNIWDNINLNKLDPVRHPVLYTIVRSFCKFKSLFYTVNNNIDFMRVFDNELLTRGRNNARPLEEHFWGHNIPPIPVAEIRNIMVGDISSNLYLKPLEVLNDNLVTPLSLVTFMRLQEAFTFLRNKISKTKFSWDGIPSMNIDTFLGRFKKGSKHFRKILSICTERNKNVDSFKKFLNLCGNLQLELVQAEKILGLWNSNFMQNKFREFIFKYRSNLLGLNVRVNHFNRDTPRGCTFCFIQRKIPVQDETFSHLFFDCNHTKTLRGQMLNYIIDDGIVLTDLEKRKLFLLGIYGNEDFNLFTAVAMHWLNYCIWDAKLRKHLISFSSILNNFYFGMDQMLTVSSKLRVSKTNCFLKIARNWEAARDARRGQ